MAKAIMRFNALALTVTMAALLLVNMVSGGGIDGGRPTRQPSPDVLIAEDPEPSSSSSFHHVGDKSPAFAKANSFAKVKPVYP